VTDASMTVGYDSADTARIALFGEIDMANADEVEQQILGTIGNQLTAVTIDLGGLEYIDSAGLRVLFTLGSRLDVLQIALRIKIPMVAPSLVLTFFFSIIATLQVFSEPTTLKPRSARVPAELNVRISMTFPGSPRQLISPPVRFDRVASTTRLLPIPGIGAVSVSS